MNNNNINNNNFNNNNNNNPLGNITGSSSPFGMTCISTYATNNTLQISRQTRRPPHTANNQNAQHNSQNSHLVYFEQWVEPFVDLILGRNINNDNLSRIVNSLIIHIQLKKVFECTLDLQNAFYELNSTCQLLHLLGLENLNVIHGSSDELNKQKIESRVMSIISTSFMQKLIENPPLISNEQTRKVYIQQGLIQQAFRRRKIENLLENNCVYHWLSSYLQFCLLPSSMDKRQELYKPSDLNFCDLINNRYLITNEILNLGDNEFTEENKTFIKIKAISILIADADCRRIFNKYHDRVTPSIDSTLLCIQETSTVEEGLKSILDKWLIHQFFLTSEQKILFYEDVSSELSLIKKDLETRPIK